MPAASYVPSSLLKPLVLSPRETHACICGCGYLGNNITSFCLMASVKQNRERKNALCWIQTEPTEEYRSRAGISVALNVVLNEMRC